MNFDFPSARRHVKAKLAESRDSAEGISVPDFERWQTGKATPGQLLSERLRERGAVPPTEQEVARFAESLDQQERHFGEMFSRVTRDLLPTIDLAERVGVNIEVASLFPDVDAFEVPDIAGSTPPGQKTIEAVQELKTEMVAQQKLTTEILARMITNADDAAGKQLVLSRRTLWVALATFVVSLTAVIVALVALH